MQIQIDPNTTFSTGQVDRMLNFNKGRTKLLCDKGLVPGAVRAETDGSASHWRVKYKDLDQVLDAHRKVRTINRQNPQMVVRRDEWNELVTRIEAMEEKVEFLGQAFDHYTAPELEQPVATR
jgi:hypothetical protein